MSANAYEVARQHATIEINEINAQIETLTQRKGLVEKLLALFEQLDTQSSSVQIPVESSGFSSSEVAAPEVAEPQSPEFQAAAQGVQQ
jgi:hypothetical protein